LLKLPHGECMSRPESSQKLDLESIGEAQPSASTKDDPQAKLESEFFVKSREAAEVKGIYQDLEERKKYAGRIFNLICGWLCALFGLLLLQGFGGVFPLIMHTFKLADSVVLALVGTTTLNVVGILYVVAYYLFPRKPR
jgi:hypothetical protein